MNKMIPKFQQNLILTIGSESVSITLSRAKEKEQSGFIVHSGESDLEDNFYHSEKSFNTLAEAVKYLYLKYPILELYLLEANPDYILTISKKAGAENSMYNMDLDDMIAFEKDYQLVKEYPIAKIHDNAPLILKWIYQIRPIGKDY